MIARVKKLSISTQITILLVSLVLVSTAVVGGLSYRYTRLTLERDAQRIVGLIADSRRDSLLARLQNKRTRVASMLKIAEKTCDYAAAASNEGCLRNIFDQFLKGTSALALSYSSPGHPTVALGDHLAALAEIPKPDATEVIRLGKDLAGNDAFEVAIHDADSGSELVGLYNTSEIGEVFKPIDALGKTGEAFLTDKSGRLLTPLLHHDVTNTLAASTATPVRECLKGQSDEVIAPDFEGRSSVHGYRAMPEIGGGCVVAYVDEAEAFASAAALRRALILGCGFFALVGSIFAVVLARWIVKPITKLAQAAEAFHEGEFSQTIGQDGPIEIRALSKAFATMANKLMSDVTELTNSREALEESEERFRRAVVDAPYPIMLRTDDGHVLQLNREWERLSSDVELTAMAKMAPNGEVEILSRSGDKRLWSLSSAPVGHMPNGRELLISMAVDLTERKRAEEAMRFSRERLDLVLSSVDVGLWYCDLPNRTLVLDGKSTEHFGQSMRLPVADERLHLQESFSYLHPEDRPRVMAAVEQAIGSRDLYDVEFRVVSPMHRTPRWIRALGKTFFGEDGQAQRFDGITVDVTEKKETEELLKNQQMWLESLLNLLPVPLVLVAPDSARVVFSNDAANRLGVVVQRSLGDLLDEEPDAYFSDAQGVMLPAERAPVARVGRGEKLDGVEMQWHSNGTAIPLLLFSQTLPAIYGHARMSILMFQDITDLKSVEVELSKAVKSRDEFLATLSHELRTPLNVILGWIDILDLEKFNPVTFARAVETLGRNATVLKELIDELLEVSRIMSGKFESKTKPLKLDGVITSVVHALQPRAAERGISLSYENKGDAVLVNGDSTRLNQVVSNLLQNALKFTDKEGRIDVSLVVKGERAVVTVKDSGIGIAPTFLPFVFERLQQENMGTTRSHGGLGLGLAITKHIVSCHGGQIRAESGGRGKGTAFIFEIPILKVASAELADALPEGQSIESMIPPGDKQLSKLKVLVIDDSPDILSLITKWLKDQGATVTSAESAKEGFQLLQKRKFDVLLSDIGMPEEDGYSFIERVRHQHGKSFKDIPAAALTAYARVEERKQIIAAGFQLHVTKPVDKTTLIRAVRDLAELT